MPAVSSKLFDPGLAGRMIPACGFFVRRQGAPDGRMPPGGERV